MVLVDLFGFCVLWICDVLLNSVDYLDLVGYFDLWVLFGVLVLCICWIVFVSGVIVLLLCYLLYIVKGVLLVVMLLGGCFIFGFGFGDWLFEYVVFGVDV